MIKVVLAEDHHVVRAAVAALLEREEGIVVAGQVTDGAALSETVDLLKPDVVVLDAHMPGFKTIEAARRLRTQSPSARILVLSAYDRREYIVGLLNAGASGYVLKDDSPEELVRAVRAVARGERWLSARIAQVLISSVGSKESAALDRLTEREQEVLQLIGRGYRNDQIVRELSISEQTVKNHIRNIFGKIGVTSRVEAVLYAIKAGLAEADQ